MPAKLGKMAMFYNSVCFSGAHTPKISSAWANKQKKYIYIYINWALWPRVIHSRLQLWFCTDYNARTENHLLNSKTRRSNHPAMDTLKSQRPWTQHGELASTCVSGGFNRRTWALSGTETASGHESSPLSTSTMSRRLHETIAAAISNGGGKKVKYFPCFLLVAETGQCWLGTCRDAHLARLTHLVTWASPGTRSGGWSRSSPIWGVLSWGEF